MYTIEKQTGTLAHGRLIVKGFRDESAMHKFLNSTDNSWRQSTKGLKPGTYAFAGGAWHNVRSLDPAILVHI